MPLSVIPAHNRMSTRRGLPDQGSRGSSHGSRTVFSCAGSPGADWSAASTAGSSVTALRYTCTRGDHKRGGPMEKYLAPETAARMAAAAAAFSGALDESQRYVLTNDFELSGVRRALMLVGAPAIAHLFDPERYCFRIFGLPGGAAPWGWQLAGHHVSLNFTVTGGRYLSPTPCMLGSVPASYGTLAPLADDEARGRAFVTSLPARQRAAAIIAR